MSESSAKKTNDAEALVQRYLEDPRPDTKDLIIVHYSGMVERIARRYAGSEPLDDLVQVGYIGLLNALSKFDAGVGVQFNTYATHLIAGEIKHYLRDRAQTIRHPAWLQELRHKVNKASQSLQAELQRQPTEREIAEKIGVSESAVQEVVASLETVKLASLDVTAGEDGEGDSDLEKLDAALSSIEQVSVEDRVLLESAMEQLRELEREVLCLFHFDALNQTEIANRLGISCNYVSHILRQSLTKLRKILSKDDADERNLRSSSPEERTVLDPELGIYDEDYFRARLSEEAHRAVSLETTVSVVLVEIDGLRDLRGFYGEDTVRDFLIDSAAFLKQSLRALDLVCRNGSTGFGLILPGTGGNIEMIKDRVQKRVDQWLVTRMSGQGAVKFHFGWASAPDDGRGGADLIKVAMRRMHGESGKAAA